MFALFAFTFLGFCILKPVPCAAAEIECPDGRLCPARWLCCELGCCAPATTPSRREDEPYKEPGYNYPWYAQWPVLFLLGTLGGILICCIWCLLLKRSHGVSAWWWWCCARRPPSEHDSAGSAYPPPQYSRCGSFHHAPPPYSEVTSKPDLYPLVITCGDGDGKAGGNYLMVHYFRNYVIRAPGSLSATSTAESLNSSFICNAANEANSIVPPPYSCASNYPECGAGCGRSLLRSLSSLTDARARPRPPESRARDTSQTFRDNLITSPVQPLDPSFDLDLELIDCEIFCEGGCKPRLGTSPPVPRSPLGPDEHYEPEPYGLRHVFAAPEAEPGPCESPPQPTSPTQSRDSTLRRYDDRRHRRLESVKKTRARKSSLYMPLSVAYPVRTSRISPGSRASSRSAPATPCSGLVPNLLTFTQRVSASRHSSRSSRLEEESNPLLCDAENTRADHKF